MWKNASVSILGQTLAQAHQSTILNNKLPILILFMGALLLLLSMVGMYTSNRLHGSSSEDVRASRYTVTRGFVIMNFYMMANVVMVVAFLYSTIWFVIFGSAPAAWLESSYYLKKQTSDVVSSQFSNGPLESHQTHHRSHWAPLRHDHCRLVDQPAVNQEALSTHGQNQHFYLDPSNFLGGDGNWPRVNCLNDD